MSDNVRQLRSPRELWDVTTHAAVADARFVSPREFLDGLAGTSAHRGLVRPVVCEALAAAADDEGVLLDFDERAFFDIHVTDVMQHEPLEHGDEVPLLVYDPFAALALMDCLTSLVRDGLLATRGNGDTVDYRLTLPGPAVDDSLARALATKDEVGEIVSEFGNLNSFLTGQVTEKLFEFYDIYPKADPRHGERRSSS
jgi:hypothetical protein